MSKLIENIKRLAAMIKGETKSGGNTAARVGGLFEEIGAELENKYDKTEADQLMIRHNTADDSHLNVQEKLIQKINDVREMLLAADQSISQDLATHTGTKSIHKTSEEIRAEIVDADIPETLARVSYVEQEKAAILGIAQEYVTQGIAKVVGGAPDALDALNELAAAINNDPNFAASMMALLNSKAESVHTHTRNQISDFPASMPASDVYPWAKQPNKPTYTPSEVGASPSNHNHAGVYQPAGSYAPANHNHTKNQISDFPASMPASDVYPWAKQPNKPTYTPSEVGAATNNHNHDGVYQPAGSYAPANHNHTKNQISDFPASMPASDVYSWAKQPNKPAYTADEISDTKNKVLMTSAERSKLAGLEHQNLIPNLRVKPDEKSILVCHDNLPTCFHNPRIVMLRLKKVNRNKKYNIAKSWRWGEIRHLPIAFGTNLTPTDFYTFKLKNDNGWYELQHNDNTYANIDNLTKGFIIRTNNPSKQTYTVSFYAGLHRYVAINREFMCSGIFALAIRVDNPNFPPQSNGRPNDSEYIYNRIPRYLYSDLAKFKLTIHNRLNNKFDYSMQLI